MEHPLETIDPPQPGEASAVARGLAASLSFERHEGETPAWLRDSQRPSVARAILALERHGGALLADPTGSGKTYEALAVGQIWPGRRPLLVVAPAAIRLQWERTAARLGVPIAICSHERVSRGVLPPLRPRLVVVDESHRFRNPASRRYRTLAPYLVGIPTLLLSATPVVNRLGDLASQLLLGVRDDALSWYGLPSLASLLKDGQGHPALGALVISRAPETTDRPAVVQAEIGEDEVDRVPEPILTAVEALGLSTRPAIAAMLRTVLYRAAASSPAALHDVLRRYRKLLGHAVDAREAGRPLDRRLLRRFTREQDEQLVLWALTIETATESELVLEDATGVQELLATCAHWMAECDRKADELHALLQDGRMSLVFSNYRETVRYLRHRLAPLAPAWCTGDRAGIGHVGLSRDDVLAWFTPARRPTDRGPAVLLTTDVSAEGLDLQLADRVVHYDLPWTAVRLEQRVGRAARLGSTHRVVDVVRCTPSRNIEHRLKGEAILLQKQRFPAQAGLGDDGRGLFRWREELFERLPPGDRSHGIALVDSLDQGIIAGLELTGETGPRRLRVASVGWLPRGGAWTEAPEEVEPRLMLAAAARLARPATAQESREALEALWPSLLARLRQGRAAQWSLAAPGSNQARLQERLRSLIARAARARDRRQLVALERGIRFVSGGHTAGEADLVCRLAAGNDTTLEQSLSRLPEPRQAWEAVHPRLTGILVFTTFPACHPSAPCCSTSTAPSSTRSD